MTQKDKELDIRTRLHYGVKGIITYDKSKTVFTVKGIDNNVLHLSDAESCHLEDFKPYLRSLSTMTDEERTKLRELSKTYPDPEKNIVAVVEFFNSHHFDYRLLIEDGLAIEAPEGMYK